MAELRGERAARATIGALDVVALALAGISMLAVWAMQLAVVPTFAAIFADFGGELPAATLLVMRPIVAGVATLGVLLACAAGVAMRLRRVPFAGVPLVLAAISGPLAIALMLVLLYLPIFAIAENVR